MNVDGLNYCALAHAIVAETSCAHCGAAAGKRCVARRRGGPLDVFGRALAPSRSHRARVDAWWKARV